MERQRRYKVPIPDETRNILVRRATSENRSISNLIETILVEAALEWERKHPPAVDLRLQILPGFKMVVIDREGRELGTYDLENMFPPPGIYNLDEVKDFPKSNERKNDQRH